MGFVFVFFPLEVTARPGTPIIRGEIWRNDTGRVNFKKTLKCCCDTRPPCGKSKSAEKLVEGFPRSVGASAHVNGVLLNGGGGGGGGSGGL